VNALVTDVVRDFLIRNNFMPALRSDTPRRRGAGNSEVPAHHVASEAHAKRRRLTISPSTQFSTSDQPDGVPNLKEGQYQDLNAHCCPTQQHTPHDVDDDFMHACAVSHNSFWHVTLST
jgi:hypothetical protein